jgi:hypothetical protein
VPIFIRAKFLSLRGGDHIWVTPSAHLGSLPEYGQWLQCPKMPADYARTVQRAVAVLSVGILQWLVVTKAPDVVNRKRFRGQNERG